MAYPYLDSLIARAQNLGAARVAVAYPLSASSLEATLAARRIGLIDPILVGPQAKIEALAAERKLDLATSEFLDTTDNPSSAAAAAVALCRDRQADMLMKGSLHTDELMSAVVSKEGGLRTRRRISHAFVFEMESYPKPLMIADCVVNIQPTLVDKRDITQNAIDLARIIGIETPRVGLLSAVETINPAIPNTLEAAALCKMADRGQITGAILDGPLAFDVAISAEAARIKGLASPIPGQADILVVPNLEAGNMLYKELVYLARAECAGIILGTAVPIVLTSRADSETCRITSCALAVIKANAERRR